MGATEDAASRRSGAPPAAQRLLRQALLELFRHDAERLERLAGGFLLRRLLRRAAPDAELNPRDVRGAHEAAVVRRAFDLQHRVMHLPTRPSERLLELGLVVDVAGSRVLDLLPERRHDRGLDALEPVLEVERGDGSLEHRREDVPAPRDALELIRGDVARVPQEPLTEPELLRDRGTALPRDDVRPDLGQPPLRRLLEPVEDRPRDRQLEDAVAEELEPLVRRRAVVRPRGVGEDLLQARLGQLGDETAELRGPVERVSRDVTPGAR
jgi:hypothetical protein